MSRSWWYCALLLHSLVLTANSIAAPATIGPVTAADSLWSLARAARADAPYSLYQAMIALQQQNPSAFIGGNVHRVKAGAMLQLPSTERIAAIDAGAARRQVEADAAALSVSQTKAQTMVAVPASPAGQLVAAVPAAPPVPVATASSEIRGQQLAGQASSHWTEQLQTDSTLGLESRLFPQQGLAGQSQSQLSGNFLQEWYWQSADERHSWALSPYLRWDQRDPERHLLDIRQAFWRTVGSGWEVKLGIDQVFWGVTESLHLVDVINQTDSVDQPDGESKLGQPMLQLNLTGDWGNLQTFLLPYFRERTLPGLDGRLRLPLPIATDRSFYQSAAGRQHLDYAVRYARQIEQLDLALSYFAGTSREPLPVPDGDQLLPYYPQLTQLGLEGQWIVDNWIWKLEVVQRELTSRHWQAAVAGFEYTSVGIWDSVYDVGWLLEYQYDSRGAQSLQPGQRDLFVGARVAWNDEAGTELLFGVVQDLQDGSSRSGMLEASTRWNNDIRLRVDAWFFHTTAADQPTWWLRRDDFIQLGIDYYF
jgi:FimV-like protein